MTGFPSLARRLLDRGIPVVVCSPNPGWTPGCSQPELIPPKGWNTIDADQARTDIAKYRPGIDVLAMVGGHGIDVLDIDTKNPGVLLDDIPTEIRTFGKTRTPSGGYHLPEGRQDWRPVPVRIRS